MLYVTKSLKKHERRENPAHSLKQSSLWEPFEINRQGVDQHVTEDPNDRLVYVTNLYEGPIKGV